MPPMDRTDFDSPPPETASREAAPSASHPEAVQRVIKVRRDYNDWVARESLEAKLQLMDLLPFLEPTL